jgi:hypothetical protein
MDAGCYCVNSVLWACGLGALLPAPRARHPWESGGAAHSRWSRHTTTGGSRGDVRVTSACAVRSPWSDDIDESMRASLHVAGGTCAYVPAWGTSCRGNNTCVCVVCVCMYVLCVPALAALCAATQTTAGRPLKLT